MCCMKVFQSSIVVSAFQTLLGAEERDLRVKGKHAMHAKNANYCIISSY